MDDWWMWHIRLMASSEFKNLRLTLCWLLKLRQRLRAKAGFLYLGLDGGGLWCVGETDEEHLQTECENAEELLRSPVDTLSENPEDDPCFTCSISNSAGPIMNLFSCVHCLGQFDTEAASNWCLSVWHIEFYTVAIRSGSPDIQSTHFPSAEMSAALISQSLNGTLAAFARHLTLSSVCVTCPHVTSQWWIPLFPNEICRKMHILRFTKTIISEPLIDSTCLSANYRISTEYFFPFNTNSCEQASSNIHISLAITMIYIICDRSAREEREKTGRGKQFSLQLLQ